MVINPETSGGRVERRGDGLPWGSSANMSMWFMDWFNLQATCLSIEGFTASMKVSREIKTEYRRYFLLFNFPWCFPPCLILGFRYSTRSLLFFLCFSWPKPYSCLTLTHLLCLISVLSMDCWTVRSISQSLFLIFAHRTPESHVQISADSSWLGVLSNVLFMLGKVLVLLGEQTFPAFTYKVRSTFVLFAQHLPIPIASTFSLPGPSILIFFTGFSRAPNCQCFPLLQVETKSICMTSFKVMGFKLEQTEALIFKLFGFLFLTFCWWTKTLQ